MVLHRGCEGERELVGKSDESEREFESLGAWVIAKSFSLCFRGCGGEERA